MYMLLIIRFVGKQKAGQFSPVLVTVLVYNGALTLKEDENSSCHGTAPAGCYICAYFGSLKYCSLKYMLSWIIHAAFHGKRSCINI